MINRTVFLVGALALGGSAWAGGFNSGSDGSDGAFSPLASVQIDLGLATTGSWDMPGDGNGVYDPQRWIVVFKYTTVSIPSSVLVTFQNHPSGAPVVWLAQGDVVIAGFIQLNGGNYFGCSQPYQFSHGGPGGFDGGSCGVLGFAPSSGFGPGGATFESTGNYAGGNYAYGNSSVFPLIGGSGGAGWYGLGGGAGGGAILIASSGTINHTGDIQAIGGVAFSGATGGSGGGIRLVASTIVGTGSLQAYGGQSFGGPGRIRLEALNPFGFTGSSNPQASTSLPPGPIIQDDMVPTLRVTMVDGEPVPQDPDAGVLTKEFFADNDVVTLTIEATNIPLGTVIEVQVRPAHEAHFVVFSTPLAGSTALSTTTASVLLPSFPADIQLRAAF